jgi:hypothetical protein
MLVQRIYEGNTSSWPDSDRSCELNRKNKKEIKTRPFDNRERWVTRKFNIYLKPGPPAIISVSFAP